jgi:hypothetical protein
MCVIKSSLVTLCLHYYEVAHSCVKSANYSQQDTDPSEPSTYHRYQTSNQIFNIFQTIPLRNLKIHGTQNSRKEVTCEKVKQAEG